MNTQAKVIVLIEDHKTIPYKTLEHALKADFQCIIISDLEYLKLCKEMTSAHLQFINKGEAEPKSELSLKGWTATWRIRDEGPFDIYKFRLDWSHYSPDGIKRNLDISRYYGMHNIHEAIKKLIEVSQFSDWKGYDLHNENLKLKADVEKLKEEKALLENKISALKQILE